jgi:signal transduction histidine kinase
LVSACLDGAARSSCSVLLVDDDAPFRESIADFLRGEGFKVEEAGRASEGLEKLFAGSFDVVFSDYHMPDMSGVQMIERIRQRLPDIKVVLLTGEADLDSAMHAVHLRVHAYLSKPVNPDALLSVLDRALRERRLESQVKDLLQELRSANERLEEFDRMKSRFLFLVAHDIRSPLSGAKGFVDFVLLRNHDLPAKVKEEIGMVSHALDQVNFLVSDLMDLGRMQSGKLKVTPELMDPRRLSSALKDRFSVLAEQERVKLSWDDAEAPERITADPLRLDQVVSNLVGNAVKHAGEASRVSVRFGSRDGGLSVDITDDGPGLEAAALERIFEPFYQGNDPMALKKGLGLGLAIVRELVEAHGGRVWAESEGVGKGCTFRVLLPAQPPAAEPKA